MKHLALFSLLAACGGLVEPAPVEFPDAALAESGDASSEAAQDARSAPEASTACPTACAVLDAMVPCDPAHPGDWFDDAGVGSSCAAACCAVGARCQTYELPLPSRVGTCAPL